MAGIVSVNDGAVSYVTALLKTKSSYVRTTISPFADSVLRKSSVLRNKLLILGAFVGSTFDTVVVIVVPAGNESGKLRSIAPENPAMLGRGRAATTDGAAATVGLEVNGDALGIGTGVGDDAGNTVLGELFELPHALSASALKITNPAGKACLTFMQSSKWLVRVKLFSGHGIGNNLRKIQPSCKDQTKPMTLVHKK